MPTYEYKCRDCSYEFEELQSMSAESLIDCPQCNTPNLYRVISGAGMIFKGKGFYLTDYKNGSGKSGENKTSPATPAAPPSPTTSSTSETKQG